MSAPHASSPVLSSRRHGATFLSDETGAAMYVEWDAPAEDNGKPTLILVHGGGGQGTDWTITHGGTPAWRDSLVEAGFPVYVVDRPGHGRASHHPASPGVGGPAPAEVVAMMFAPADAPEHTQWTWSRDPQGPEVQRFAASQAPLPGDSAVAQAEEATLLAKLIDLTGPAVVVTHSAGAPSGWLAAQERPGQVLAVVAVEPMGPPFVNMPGFGELTWGLSTARMVSEPASETPDELQQHPDRALPGLTGTPVLVVTASASPAAPNGHLVAQFLSEHGAQVTDLALADEGITGNAHGLMAEANSAESVQPVIAWLNRTVNT